MHFIFYYLLIKSCSFNQNKGMTICQLKSGCLEVNEVIDIYI